MFTAPKTDKHWNRNVQQQIDALKKVMAWGKLEERYAVKHKDWYTARALGRVLPFLQIAVIELYDLQYFEDEGWINKWRKAQCVDPL